MIGKQNEKSKDGAKVRQSAFLAGALLQIWGITKAALRWGCGGGVGSSMAWGYPPALWLSLVCGNLCDVLRSGAALRAGDTWQGKRLSLLQGKRRSTVWGCLLDVGMVYGQGLADGSSLLQGGLSLLMAGPACGIKKFFFDSRE